MRSHFIVAVAVSLCLAALSTAQASIRLVGKIHQIDGDGDTFADDLKISRILFTVTAGTTVEFDALVWESRRDDLNGDGFITAFNSQFGLLTASGAFLAYNDDDGGPVDQNGSLTVSDPAMEYTFATAGTYMLTIGQSFYDPVPYGFQGYVPDTPYYAANNLGYKWGAWTVDMRWSGGSVTNVIALDDTVPEPATIGVWSLLGIGAVVAYRASRVRVA